MSETKKPRRISKAERRRQLLQAAKRVFAERGYTAAAPHQVAEAAGVSEGVLLRHFPHKHDLFFEFLRELRQTTLNRWQAAAAELADPLARLHAVIDVYLAATRVQAEDFRILHGALLEGEADLREGVLAYYLDCEALLAQAIAEGQQSGVFRRNLDPRVGAWELICSALGHTMTARLGVPLHQEEGYLARAVDCLLHALLKVDV
jgi:AcrR family transcriptional regulator